MKNKRGKNPSPAVREIITVAVAFAVALVAALAARLVSILTTWRFSILLTVFLLLAGAVALLVLNAVRKRTKVAGDEVLDADTGNIFGMVRKLVTPAVICDKSGAILWYNDAFGSAADSVSKNASTVKELFPNSTHLLAGEGERGGQFMLGSRTYKCSTYELRSHDKNFVLLMLSDISELLELKESYKNEQPVIVYIKIDNLEEMQQYLQDEYRQVEMRTNDVIKQWAEGLGGVLREYERNKYVMFITSEALDRCIANKFSVLDEIRDIRDSESGTAVTASIGAARIGGALSERDAAAAEAQKFALERGGDQAVVRTEESGMLYFGGVSQTAQKATKVRSRVFANELCKMISTSDNVIICGHRKIDFDAFGACVGIARMAFFCGVKANIVVDLDDPTVKLCMARFRDAEEYEGVFIGEDDALELVSSETLMVFCDVNNPKLFEAPRVAQAVERKVFIDHHRKVLDFDYTTAETYIEVSASSASELVAEMIEQSLPPRTLLRQEAELLLAGIQLDTKRFTKATGPRTFGAALFLRGAGANPEETRALFDTEIEAMRDEAEFEAGAVVYAKHPNVAIAASGTASVVCAARVADKLLELRGVDASFTMVPVSDAIHISGRSNGRVNVQHILEKLGGGGRFEEAGAQLKEESLDTAAKQLRGAIDEYFSELGGKK
ncbi:MAG: DHH family phosphoesterase [Clostridia bacterium]|nr:DHH family phosphoesterase [Clostridia bacterium]